MIVRMVHDWGGPVREVDASLVEGKKEALVAWGAAGLLPLSLYSGRLKGTRKARMWRMQRNHLSRLRKLAGWKPRPRPNKEAAHADA